MKIPLLLPPAWLLAVFLLISLPHRAPAQDPPPAPARPDTAQLLREALFEEQGVRDLDKAAAAYQKVIAAYDAERQLAATALYRLAEVRRAQNKKDEAAALYQRLLTEFPTHDPLARLSRENLAALGVKGIPGADPAVADEQDTRIAELKRMLQDSPDLVRGSAQNQPLWLAAHKGQTKVVTFLLEAGAKAEDRILEVAAGKGHLSVCEALVAHGADVNNSGALLQAVKEDRLEVVRLLLEKGADPNYQPDPKNVVESALFSAVVSGNKEILDLLIKAKADPNLPPPAQSPLWYAVRNGNVPLAKRLLEIGADVRVRCLDASMPNFVGYSKAAVGIPRPVAFNPGQKKDPEYTPTTSPQGWTLLHAAVMSQSVEMLDLLLPLIKDLEDPGHSGKQTALALAVGAQRAEMAEHLLKAGADGKVLGNNGLPLLFGAADALNEPLVKRLLSAGADPRQAGSEGRTVLSSLANHGEKALPVIRLLVAAGADPEAGEPSLMQATFGALPVRLAREFRYPKWAASGQVTLSLPENWGYSIPLATKASAVQPVPPSLADLLLEAKFRWLNQPAPDWTTLHLFRRDPQGVLQEQIIPDWLEGKAPVLQWGDVVEFVATNWEDATSGNRSYEENLPPEIQNRLRAAQVRLVTVNLDGKTYPMTLRGALKVYNPLKPEAPLTDAVTLMKMMGGDDPRWFNSSVRVKRLPEQGGGEITSPLQKYAIIPLKEGDFLELTGGPVTWQRHGNGITVTGTKGGSYTEDIFLLSPDLPFSRIIRKSSFSSPTLIQLLAAAFPPLAAESLAKLATSEKTAGVMNLTGSRAAATLTEQDLQSILPHPDWSQLKIRRITPNDGITEITVDLPAAIAACTDDTTPEAARKADVELMAGDTLLLPVRRDLKDQPWTGWDAGTIRFFSKALAIQVTLADADGSFRALNLDYMPVRYIDTAAGLLGLPAKEPAPPLLSTFSTPALLTGAANGKWLAWLQRAGSADRSGPDNTFPDKWFWLRDKDTIGLSVSSAPRPGQPQPNQPQAPRRRAVLPSPPAQ